VRKIHVHCLPKFHQDRCEVCGETVNDIMKLPPEIRDQVYNPSVDGPVEDFTLEKMERPPDIPEVDVDI